MNPPGRVLPPCFFSKASYTFETNTAALVHYWLIIRVYFICYILLNLYQTLVLFVVVYYFGVLTLSKTLLHRLEVI